MWCCPGSGRQSIQNRFGIDSSLAGEISRKYFWFGAVRERGITVRNVKILGRKKKSRGLAENVLLKIWNWVNCKMIRHGTLNSRTQIQFQRYFFLTNGFQYSFAFQSRKWTIFFCNRLIFSLFVCGSGEHNPTPSTHIAKKATTNRDSERIEMHGILFHDLIRKTAENRR